MRFAELIALLSLDPQRQLRFLGYVPENVAVRDYVRKNSVFRMAWLYQVSYGIYDAGGGAESSEGWLARTGLPATAVADCDSPFWISARRLLTAVDMIFALDNPFLFSAHGLRRAPEWELVRHLASETLELGEFPHVLTSESFESLWLGLGGGVIETAWHDE